MIDDKATTRNRNVVADLSRLADGQSAREVIRHDALEAILRELDSIHPEAPDSILATLLAKKINTQCE